MGLSIKNTPIFGVPMVCIAWIVAITSAILVYRSTREIPDEDQGEMGARAEGDAGDGGHVRAFQALEMNIDTMFTVYVVMLSVIAATGVWVIVQFCRGRRGPIPPSIGEMDDFLPLRAITSNDVRKSLLRTRRHRALRSARTTETIDQGPDDGLSFGSSDGSEVIGTSFAGGGSVGDVYDGLTRIRVNDGSVDAL
jgi:hypothetical protein